MAEGNGKAVGGMMAPPTDTATFRIGGQDVEVPALTLAVLGRCKDAINGLSPELDFITYSQFVIKILATALKAIRPELTEEFLSENCSVVEMRNLAQSLHTLFEISGFSMGEAEAAGDEATQSLGTGTSTPSPQNSQPQGFVEATSTGSNEPIP